MAFLLQFQMLLSVGTVAERREGYDILLLSGVGVGLVPKN